MAEYTALIEQLCAKRSTLVQAMAANPRQITDEQIRDLAWLQSAFAAVEAEHRRAERETLHKEFSNGRAPYLRRLKPGFPRSVGFRASLGHYLSRNLNSLHSEMRLILLSPAAPEIVGLYLLA